MKLGSPISLLPLPSLAEPPWNDKGGEAFIYEHPTDKEFLVKVFHVNRVRRGRRGPDAEHLIDLNSFSDGLTPSQSVRLSECFSWPATLYGSSLDCIDGIAIRRAANEFWLDYEDVYGWNHQVQNLAFLGEFLKAPIIKKAPYTDISFEDRIELAMEYLRSMQCYGNLDIDMVITPRTISYGHSSQGRACSLSIPKPVVGQGQRGRVQMVGLL